MIAVHPVVDLKAHRLGTVRAHHGEGAIWDASLQRFVWVDMLAGRVMMTDALGHTTSVQMPDPVAALVRPHADGGHVIIGERTVWWRLLDAPCEPFELLTLPVPPACRANEGACDVQGRLVVGSMAYAETRDAGAVWRIEEDSSITPVLSSTSISNGTVFDSEHTVVFADSATGEVCRFDVQPDGRWANRRVLVRVEGEGIGPDGICMDEDGGVWVALWGASSARRWDAQGLLTHSVSLPTPQVTSVALGGPDRRTLFITTSAVGRPDTDATAGACFVTRVQVPGLPIRPCRVPGLPTGTEPRDV